MALVHLAVGALVLSSVAADLLWTTLWVEGGAGPLTSRLMAGTWRAFHRVGGDDGRLLSLAGPVILVGSLGTWLLLLWVGWTLVFAGSKTALVDTIGGDPVGWVDRLYFAGYAMFTLGNGGFSPTEGAWQVVTVLVTASGMLFVTLSVTYVLSVLDAVTQKRQFATGVTGLGTRGAELVRAAWDGQEFRGFDHLLNTYVTQLNALTANHKAYPILHYFYSQDSESAPVTSVAVLDDALAILRFGVPAERRPSAALLTAADASVQGYVETLHGTFVQPADDAPPLPGLDPLRDADIPTRSDDEFAAAIGDRKRRRRTMLGLVEADARKWPVEQDG